MKAITMISRLFLVTLAVTIMLYIGSLGELFVFDSEVMPKIGLLTLFYGTALSYTIKYCIAENTDSSYFD